MSMEHIRLRLLKYHQVNHVLRRLGEGLQRSPDAGVGANVCSNQNVKSADQGQVVEEDSYVFDWLVAML